MRNTFLVLAILFIVCSSELMSNDKSESIRAKINKSFLLKNYKVEKFTDINFITDGYGLSGEYQFKIFDKISVGLYLGYNAFITEDSLRYVNNGKLKVSSVDLLLTLTREFQFTEGYDLFLSLGGGFTYFSANETFVNVKINNNSNYIYNTKGLYPQYTFVLNPRIGSTIPIGNDFFTQLDFDANLIFSEKLAIIPRINFGFGYSF